MTDHDIKLTIGSTTKKIRLAKSNGRKLWEVPELYSGTATSEKLFDQTDWSGGFGEGNYNSINRYANGENIDTTKKGEFILGPKISGVSSCQFLDGAVADDGGAYTDEINATKSATANDVTLVPATPAVNDAYHFGSSSTFSTLVIRIGTNGVGTWTIVWEYWDGDSWESLSNLTDNTSGFTAGTGYKTVTFDIPGDWATVSIDGKGPYYYVRARVSAYTSITTQPKGTQVWCGYGAFGDITLTKLIYFNSTIYAALDEYLYEWNIALDYWLEKTSYAGDITDLCVFNGKLYIAVGNAAAYQYTTDGGTFTSTDLTDSTFTYFMVAPSALGTTSILWGASSNEVKSTSNPDASGTEWSDPYYIGDSTTSITGLMLHNNQIYIGKSDGLWYLDSDGKTYPLLPELQYAQSSNNFKHHINYKGSLYFSLDTRVGEITSARYYSLIDPYQGLSDLTIKGQCNGLASDRDYIYATMYDGTNNIIYKGVKNIEGTWSWTPFASQNDDVEHTNVIQISTNNPRLWFRHSNGTMGYCILSDNPLGDSNYEFNSTSDGYLVTGWIDLGNRDWVKIVDSVNCECRNSTGDLSATDYVKIYYEFDESGSWTAIDSVYTDNNSIVTKKYLDATTLANGRKVRFKISLVSNSLSTTPIVKYFSAYGQVRPPHQKIFNFSVDVDPSDGVVTSKNMKDFLNSGRDSTGLITLVDRHNTSHYVEFLPGSPKEEERLDEVGKEYRLVMTIQALEIDWS